MKNKNSGLDIGDFEKIEDIIFLDEPILTHYKRNDKDFFLYLVETFEELDYYLLLELNEEEIFYYLTGRTSLYNLISNNKNFIHLIKQDFNGKINEVKVIHASYIDENYLPDKQSFLNYEPLTGSYYYNFIEEYKSKPYLNLLRQKAFYLKIAPKNRKYADTIGFNELANTLLVNISKSFKSFLKADFLNSFKTTISDSTKLDSIFKKILPELDYRMVDLKYGSFEIGLSVDDVMISTYEHKDVNSWAKKVGYKYQNLILNEFDNNNTDEIIEKFDEEDRKQIFNPIFKITENTDYQLTVKKTNNNYYTKIKVRDKSIIEKIIPNRPVKHDDKELQIINVTTIIDKNKKKQSISLKDSLFDSSDKTEVVIKNKEFLKFGYQLDFEISIPLEISTQKNKIILNAKYDNIDFQSIVSTGRIDDGINDITHKIYEYILNK